MIEIYVLTFIRCPRPLIVSHGSPFIKKKESITFPYKSLESICFLSAEQIQDTGSKYTAIELSVYDTGQTFDSEAQVCVSADDVDLFEAGYISKHWKPP